MKKIVHSATKLVSLCMAALLMTTPVYARAYNDKKQILNTGFVLDTDRELLIANPSKDVSTTASEYYITGASDPSASLTCNGAVVEDRGVYGTFGVYVSLQDGKNTFTFQNAGRTESVTITKTTKSSGGGIYTIDDLRRIGPKSNDVVKSGETFRIRCTAPANGKVTATLNDETIELKQEAIASTGVEAYYSAEIDLPTLPSGQWEDLGPITYRLKYNGKTDSAVSAGHVFLLGKGASIFARVNQNAAVLYEKGQTDANQVSIISRGAVDSIVDSTDTHYKLKMGNWILKDYVDIVANKKPKPNHVADMSYSKKNGGEELVLHGTTSPAFKAYNTSEKIVVKFYNTKAEDRIKIHSSLFSSVEMEQTGSHLQMEFIKKPGSNTIGYDVSYDNKGNTKLFFNVKPGYGSDEKPLENMTIVVDPGHGGLDSGAVGVLYGKGPMEKDITMAQALVLKNRLESLGAKVILTVKPNQPKDQKVEMTDRIEVTRKTKADLYLSLHCNSISATANGLKPSGTEIYYYESNSKALADKVLTNITSYNGRKNRGVKHSNYYVTRNPLCPSMLIELGFMSNPVEYDEMCSPDALYDTANAIADAVIDYLD